MKCHISSKTSSLETDRCLDTEALGRLEQSFRDWVGASPRRDVRLSRRRVLLIFLLIRYTGAKLSEVLSLDPLADIDVEGRTVRFWGPEPAKEAAARQVQISESLADEIRAVLADPGFGGMIGTRFGVDPAFVRRKFYERVAACGLDKHLGGPEMLRKARAVELMQAKMPLAAIEKMMGTFMPQRHLAHISFSATEIEEATRRFVEREASRKSSARNTFFGKITSIRQGDIQARITLITGSGHTVSTVITNDSLERLGLAPGVLIAAEVKAPWVVLYHGEKEPACSAENRFSGVVERVTRGRISTEYVVRTATGLELCALAATRSGRRRFEQGERVWAVFSCFAVVLKAD